jgi:DNA-binding transcriptional ArsR family regulator
MSTAEIETPVEAVKPPKTKKEKTAKPVKEKTVKAVPVKATKVEPPVIKTESFLSDLTQSESDRLIRVVSALSDMNRLRILEFSNGETPVGVIGDLIGQTQPATSHHIRLLSYALLIRANRNGRQSLYELTRGGQIAVKAMKEIANFIKSEQE